jgi:hypothetical protein
MPNTELERTDPLEINPPGSTEICPTDDDSPVIGTGGLPVPQDDIRHICRHIFADGRRCGSPALKTHNFCYYHYAHRSHSVHGYGYWRNKYRDGHHFAEERLELFDGLDNPISIQLAIARVACRIADNTLNPRQARSLLYALQLAANNVRNIKTTENSTVAPDIVEDFTWGHLAEREPNRTEPETLDIRLRRPRSQPKPDPDSKPFTGYYPDYKIPPESEEVIRMKEGLNPKDPLFAPERKTRLY